MSIKLNPCWLVFCTSLLLSSPVAAVDLMGVHDLAEQNDPRLQAAEFRREATGENKSIAWSNLLPQLGAGGSWTRGDSETDIEGFPETIDSDIDTDSYRLELRQSLYRQANYEALDVARGQISQAEAIYQIAYQDFLLRVAERYFLVLTLTDGVTFAEAEEKAFQ
jgi:outer membrane protein